MTKSSKWLAILNCHDKKLQMASHFEMDRCSEAFHQPFAHSVQMAQVVCSKKSSAIQIA